MKDWLARTLAALALLGLALNGWIAWRNGQRLENHTERLEQLTEQRNQTYQLLQGMASAPAEPAPPSRTAPTRRKSKGKSKKGKKARRRDEPVPEERRASQDEAVREAMAVEIADFAETEGLDGTQEADVLEELLALREGTRLVREDMREDRVTKFEGRAEIRALREDSDARLVEMLGEDLADILRLRLAEERDARRSE